MKQIAIICACLIFTSMCEGQILKYRLSASTPTHHEMYNYNYNSSGGRTGLGLLVIVGGAALSTLGVGVAIEGVKTVFNTDDIFDDGRELWRAGTSFFLIGIGTIGIGVDMIKGGTLNVRQRKVSLRMKSNAVSLVVNFR